MKVAADSMLDVGPMIIVTTPRIFLIFESSDFSFDSFDHDVSEGRQYYICYQNDALASEVNRYLGKIHIINMYLLWIV